MTANTPNYSWPYPTGTDTPAGHTQIQALGTAADATVKTVENQAVRRFTSTSDRDTKWPTPPAGAVCYVTGVGWQRNTTGASTGWVTEVDASSTLGFVTNGLSSRIIRGGQTIVTTSASGVFTLAHGLGAVPNWAQLLCGDRASAGAPWSAAAHQANWDATNLEAAAYAMGSATGLNAKSIRVVWTAGIA